MARMHRIAAGAVIAALLATSTTPALARGPHRGWGNGGWGHGGGWRHRDRVDAGDVIAGIIILGGIAAIASAASKNRRPAPDSRYPEDQSQSRPATDDEDVAVETCARAAEARASEGGLDARVREITTVDPADDGWEIAGVVETRDGYRTRYAGGRGFICAVRHGQVEDITFDSSVAVR
ncbi:hypothetical protein [Sphingomonas cavernae]|nr:hypothetical protein [Sphingomonas cavernae]